jgi:hypothetical protein
MAVLVHELQFNGSQMTEIVGDDQRGVSLIGGSFAQRLEAKPIQSVRHRTSVPPQRFCRCLHVKSDAAPGNSSRTMNGWGLSDEGLEQEDHEYPSATHQKSVTL